MHVVLSREVVKARIDSDKHKIAYALKAQGLKALFDHNSGDIVVSVEDSGFIPAKSAYRLQILPL